MKRFLLASATCLALSLPAMAQVIPPWNLGKMRILEIQMDLKADGFYPQRVDGFWGPSTREAVMAFQKDKKLPEDGELNPQTLAALGVDLNNWFQTTGSMSKPSANEQNQSRLSSNAQAGSAKTTGQGAPSSAQNGSAGNVQANLNGASMTNPAGSSSVTPGQTVGLRPEEAQAHGVYSPHGSLPRAPRHARREHRVAHRPHLSIVGRALGHLLRIAF
ncbi:MAG TPA: peptidoglycan-binding domain-containing protein [Roseiarcus sp.]|nr:peptidoglycan-binding domain-containing protein [Roseiarcus sp.]